MIKFTVLERVQPAVATAITSVHRLLKSATV